MDLPVELQAGETLLSVYRRHWMYAYPHLAGIALIAVVPVILLLVVVSKSMGLDGFAGIATYAVSALWVLYWLIRGYFTWYRYENDIWVVTDQRVIDSIKKHWFHKQISTADLVNVQDITVVRNGILGTTFNFGDVQCETAGERLKFVLSGIPKPSVALAEIDRARDAARRDAIGPRGAVL